MTIHEVIPTVSSVTCDAHACQLVTVPPPGMVVWHSEFREWLSAQGWSLWAGHGRRTYCPVHGPKPGHRMRQMVGS